jgi:hypothetical protein
MSKQTLIDNEYTLIAGWDQKILELQTTKTTADQSITQLEQGIVSYEAQKADCDSQIAAFEQQKVYSYEKITIIENSPNANNK